MSNGGTFGWLGAAGSILGVVSTVIGIWVAIATQQLKTVSDHQKLRIDAQDSAIRASAEQRAATSAQREYLLKVYDKVIQAVETTDQKKQLVALALVESLEDPALQERLAKVFANAPTVEDPKTKERAKDIQKTASFTAATQSAAGSAKGWDYDIFWCEESAANQDTAKNVFAALNSGDPTHGRLRLRNWSASQNKQGGYGVTGYEIRGEASEQPQMEFLKRIIDPAAPQPFQLKTTTGANPTPWYLSVWVCAPR
jgi:hypothetical protein